MSDTGDPDPTLLAALARGDEREVAVALRDARVFVAIEPRLTAEAGPVTGADKASEMALVTLRVPSGATAVPAFSSVAALVAWRPAGRPVPVQGGALRQEARALGHDAVVLDIAGPSSVTIDLVEEPAVLLRDPRRRPAGRVRRAVARAARPYGASASVAFAEIGDGDGGWRAAVVVATADPAERDRITASVRHVLESLPLRDRPDLVAVESLLT